MTKRLGLRTGALNLSFTTSGLLSAQKDCPMLSAALQPVMIAQLFWADAGLLLLVTGIAFAGITLLISTTRFHRMVRLRETDLVTTEDRDNFFAIQITRYLSKINRTSSGFGVFIVQLSAESSDLTRVQKELLSRLKGVIRNTSDQTCLFHEDCVALIIDTEEEHIARVTRRIVEDLKTLTAEIHGLRQFRVGVGSFPMHGLNTQTLISAAFNALQAADFGSAWPFHIAPRPGEESSSAVRETDPGEIGELSKEDKNSAIDPLTGVLKPAVVESYMRKYLSEIRRKKESAALLCIGINRLHDIIELYGETAADEVTAGVSKVIQRLIRNTDLIGRYHRGDFMVLAPCTLQNGEKIAVRLREAVQKELFLSAGKRIKTSLSIGITAYPEHGRTLRDLFRGAYRALEVVRSWNTSSCLIYDPAQHSMKAEYETRR